MTLLLRRDKKTLLAVVLLLLVILGLSSPAVTAAHINTRRMKKSGGKGGGKGEVDGEQESDPPTVTLSPTDDSDRIDGGGLLDGDEITLPSCSNDDCSASTPCCNSDDRCFMGTCHSSGNFPTTAKQSVSTVTNRGRIPGGAAGDAKNNAKVVGPPIDFGFGGGGRRGRRGVRGA